MDSDKAWFYMSGQGDAVQNHGPFPVSTMKELFKGKYITEDALVWSEGLETWQPLRACHELYEAIIFSDADAEQARKRRKKAVDTATELAQLEAEVNAIEEASKPQNAESPEPEDREFIDDDGTKFVWDSAIRKFRPENLSAPAAAPAATGATPVVGPAAVEYTKEMMTFGGIEREGVTLEEALAEEEASAEHAQLLGGTGAAAEASVGADGDAARGPEMGPPQSSGMGGADAAGGSAAGSAAEPAAEGAPAAVPAPTATTTSVYITGLPPDCTEDEVAEEFSRVCGIIREDDNGRPKVKLYRDKESGDLKGDALITFLQRPSVNIAVKVMHGRPLRAGGSACMAVQEASFGAAGGPKAAAGGGGANGSANGAVAGGQKPKGPPGGKAKKAGASKKGSLQKEKLLGWGGYDDTHKATEVTMVISNLFTLEDMTLSPDLETDLSEYLIRRFADLGAIEQVRVLRKAPGGVATAKFRQPDAAQAALLRASATVMIWGMFAAPEMAARGDARAAEVAEDVAERAAALGVGLAGEGAVAVMRGSGAGACAVGCADIAGMQRLAMGFDGAAYDGRILRAEALEAEMWDGETPFTSYGAPPASAEAEEARLEAFGKELESD